MPGTRDVEALEAQVRSDPMDWLARLALADALEESGRAEAAALARDVADCVRAGAVARLSERAATWLLRVRRALFEDPDVPSAVLVADKVVLPRRSPVRLYVFAFVGVGADAPVLGSLNNPFTPGAACAVRVGAPLTRRAWRRHKLQAFDVYVHPEDAVYFVR
jgi:uncharacterized protein (TIGR02996 family)